MIEQAITSGDLLKMADLDDLNGAFYDIDAQDLLDVWEAMDTGVRDALEVYFWLGLNRSTLLIQQPGFWILLGDFNGQHIWDLWVPWVKLFLTWGFKLRSSVPR